MGFGSGIKTKINRILHHEYISQVAKLQFELQTRYDEFCHIEDSNRLRLAKELVAQEGKIDAEIEGYKSTENQRDFSIKFYWGHHHRFNSTFKVTGIMGDRHVNLVAQFMTGFQLPKSYFEGKSIVDVGCWTGGTSLMLKALGANEILALEEVKKYALTASSLLSDVYGISDVENSGVNLYKLQTENKYDIVYFPGVIYHLSDPILGLRRLFNVCKDGGDILVESAGINDNSPVCRFHGNRIFHKGGSKENLNRRGWNWFLPSPQCLERWMVEAGFEDVKCYYSYATNRVYGYGCRTQHVEITRAGFSVPDIE